MLARLKALYASATNKAPDPLPDFLPVPEVEPSLRNPPLDYDAYANDFLRLDCAERSLQLLGQIAVRSLDRHKAIRNLSDVEFRVYSQWGEDGIIDWLVNHVAVPNDRFVEFGVENFREANCRFLMHNRNWKGLVFDGSTKNIRWLREQALYWMHDLKAEAAFVTAENIDQLIEAAGFGGPLGILSIDVDGNDFWIWNAIKAVDPAIVICEVNPILGDVEPITVPYDPGFTRFDGHYSGLYFGASIAALKLLAERKGYSFLGTNTHGINAFFVRNDLAAPVLALLGEKRAFPSRVRDSRDETGTLSFTGGIERFALIADRPVVNVATGATIRLGDIAKPYSDLWLSGMN